MVYSYSATVTTTPFGTTSSVQCTNACHQVIMQQEDAAGGVNLSGWAPACAASTGHQIDQMMFQAMPSGSCQPGHLPKSWYNFQESCSTICPTIPAMNNIAASPMSPASLVHSNNSSPALNNALHFSTPTPFNARWEDTTPSTHQYTYSPAAYPGSPATSWQSLDPACYVAATVESTAATAVWQGYPSESEHLRNIASFQGFTGLEDIGLPVAQSLPVEPWAIEPWVHVQQLQHSQAAQQQVKGSTYSIPEKCTVQQHPTNAACDLAILSVFRTWTGDKADDGTGDLNWLCGSNDVSLKCVQSHAMELLAYEATL